MPINLHPIVPILLSLVLTHNNCLHLSPHPQTHAQSSTGSQEQLNYLTTLQNNYASGVRGLTSQAEATRGRLNGAGSVEERIGILEAAVVGERAKIGQLAAALKVDPTKGFTQCTVLPQDQQIKLNNNANQLQTHITDLQTQLKSLPECDQTASLRTELQKLRLNLANIQKVSSNQCEQNLLRAQPVYQTNLYNNNNWVLGAMSMDQLVQEYYRRFMENGNITNCPVQRPFLQGAGVASTSDSCIQCSGDRPYFDLSTKTCIKCQNGQSLDLTTRKCGYPPKNSNYEAGRNYRLDPLTQLPPPQSNLSYCPPQNPFFNGSQCVSCSFTNSYWQISESKCYLCPNYTTFNLTIRQCQKNPPIYIYGNRDRLLATNTTSIADYNNTLNNAVRKNPLLVPSQCPDMGQYAAITACVACNPDAGQYFNVETMTCTYCDGVPDVYTGKCSQRKYYFVNTNAPNLLIPSNTTIETIKANNDKVVQSDPVKYGICPESDPYPNHERSSCGKCNTQAPLYSVELSGCTYCPETQVYDPQARQCRTVTYLTNYNKNVLITPPTTLQDLLTAEAQLNKTKLTKKCPQATPFSPDGRLCMECFPVAPYFDVKTGMCVSCIYPTTYLPDRKGCYKINYLTNLSAPGLLEVQNYTVANVRNQQTQVKSDPTRVYADCPLENPYGQADMCIKCIDAGAVFNLKTQACEKCQINSVYSETARKCLNVTNITNLNAGAPKIIQSDSYTLAAYTAQLQNTKKQYPTALCPPESPFSINGTCNPCPEPTPYFILSTKQCGGCNNFVSSNNTCPPKPSRYSNLSNYKWITNDGNADKVIANTMQLKKVATGGKCPSFYNELTKDCVSCPENYYYNFDTGDCRRCESGTTFDINVHKCAVPQPEGTYFTNLQSSPNDLQIYGGLTLDQLKTTQLQLKSKYPNSQFCPTATPFYDNIQCVRCPDYKKYFNLRYRLCQVCLTNEKLQGNDCINQQGNKVWQEPVAQNVYPFLFSQV